MNLQQQIANIDSRIAALQGLIQDLQYKLRDSNCDPDGSVRRQLETARNEAECLYQQKQSLINSQLG
jgi:hypothetical protein